jgi:CBS domain-containing membrane protein
MRAITRSLANLAGLGNARTSHVEKLVSGLGGFAGILLILLVTRHFVGTDGAALIVASMGASAVLLFAVPHGPLSQPWALVGGHLVSAIIGVSCYLLIPDTLVAASCAVGLAITAMYYLQCVHPPGGASALVAVVGGPGVHDLGYQYVATPVMLNVAVILCVAVLFNYLFPWRRYPATLTQFRRRCTAKPDKAAPAKESALSHEDLQYALQQMNLYIDVSEDDLKRIYHLARHRTPARLRPEHIRLGHYYSNGEYGEEWSVRRIIDESGVSGGERDQIIYRVVAGKGRRSTGTLARDAFARWARYEVALNENSWYRVAAGDSAAPADITRPT